ncbi:MAG: SDR family oxidoreductase [bacterium]
MKNSSVLVTGGAQGIGKGIATRLCKEGFPVFIVDIDEIAGNETATELDKSGKIHFIHGDVSNEEDVKKIHRKISGIDQSISCLINNAGVSEFMSLQEMSLDDWNRIIGINLTSVFLFSKYFESQLRENKGAIINIASTRALMSEPGTEAYSASKGGIVALTHALAISLGPDVRVNCISPGWIDVSGWKKSSKREKSELTREDHTQHPAGRVGEPPDIASMVSFLMKPENSFITGQNFIVDGGMTRKMIYT